MWSFLAELMRMSPISTRVNKPENDDAAILQPVELQPPRLREPCREQADGKNPARRGRVLLPACC